MKSAGDFTRANARPDGLYAHCKVCAAATRQKWREANRERERESAKRFAKRNPEKQAAWHKAWRERNPEKTREYSRMYRERIGREAYLRQQRNASFRRKYGITHDDYDAMLDEQSGVCALCLQPPVGDKPLCVDHDHATGVVRGLLCHQCNKSLHGLVDSGWIERAAAYLS